jgi:hypothetical protein
MYNKICLKMYPQEKKYDETVTNIQKNYGNSKHGYVT